MAGHRRLTLVVGINQTLTWGMTFYLPAVIAGPAGHDLGMSRAAVLGAFSCALLISGFCAPRVGKHIDRHGGRGILVASCAISAVGLVVLALAQGGAAWYAGWLVLGVGMSLGLYDTAFATIGRILGRDARPAIIGVTLMAGFASSVGFPSGTWLVGHFGWRDSVFLYAALQILVILPVILVFIPASPGTPAVGPARVAPEGGRLPGRGEFLLLAVFFTSRAGIGAVISVHALVLLQGLGLSLDAAVATASIIGAAQVGSRVVDYFLGRNLSPVTSAQVGAVLLPVGIVATLLGAPGFVFALSYGMSNGIFTISRGTLPMHVFGPAGYATLLGRLALPSLIAQAAAPTLLAPLIDGAPAVWTFAAIGALGLAAFGCLLPLRR